MPFFTDLTILKNRGQLIKFLGMPEEKFEAVLAFKPPDTEVAAIPIEGVVSIGVPLFYRHNIPKKNRRRGTRLAWEPARFLMPHYKTLGRQMNEFLTHVVPGFPHHRTFGYIGRRNIRENARDHCGHENLISVDLKDFFPSIKAARIAGFLVSAGVVPEVAELLARFMTVGGALPLGFPTSPTIANAMCLPMDIEMEALAKRYQAINSRYADDISFSSDRPLPPLDAIRDCVQTHGFEIAESKTRTSRLGQSHYVTGLSVSDPRRPHVPAPKKSRLRQELYFAKKFGLRSHLEHLGIENDQDYQRQVNRLDGTVRYTAYHEPRLRDELRATWTEILLDAGDGPSFEPKNLDTTPVYIYVDEADYVRPDGTTALALAMSVSQHQDKIDSAAADVLDAALSDPWAAGRREVLVNEGLHFSQVTIDVQQAFVERLRSLPFDGFVAIAPLIPVDYEGSYIDLLSFMLRRRLMAADGRSVHFVFEETDKVRQPAVRQAVEEAFVTLKLINNRRPILYTVEFAGKRALGLSVPDFLAGVLGKYLQAKPRKPGQEDLYERMFERIRDKYRVIFDRYASEEYSRRRGIKPWNNAGFQNDPVPR